MILEDIADGLIVCDADWQVISCNNAAARLLGGTRNKPLGRTCWQAFPALRDSEIERAFRRAAQGEKRVLEHFCAESGRWLEMRCYPHREGGLSIVLFDITDRRLAEEALRRERDVLQALVHGARNSHLAYLDPDFNFVMVNETYAKVCGFQPEEMIGKNHFVLYPDAENEAIFTRVRDTGEPFEIHDKPFEFPDFPERGITYWDWTLSPVKDRTGKVAGLVLSLFETTARKRAEEALKENEANFRLLFERHTAIMFLIDPLTLNIQDANNAAVEFYGYTREDLRKMSLYQINIIPPEELFLLAEKVTRWKLKHFMASHRLANGTIRDVEVHATPIALGEKVMNFAIIHDVTERKIAEEQLREMNLDLERRVEQRTVELLETQQKFLHAEKLTAIGKLSASISHEFNNPLQGIMFVLKGLQDRERLEDEDRQLLAAALAEGDRIKKLIRSLQDFYRPTAGERVLVDLHRTLDSLLLLLRSDFKSRRLSLDLDYAERLPRIYAIPDQIKQVFLNLLTNAAEACHQAGDRVTVKTRLEGDRVSVAIRDTGVGITPEGMEQIFRPFYTTKPGIKGIGLGLSVSYGIVKNHGGEIRVASRPGEGTTFTVFLPIMQEADRFTG